MWLLARKMPAVNVFFFVINFIITNNFCLIALGANTKLLD